MTLVISVSRMVTGKVLHSEVQLSPVQVSLEQSDTASVNKNYMQLCQLQQRGAQGGFTIWASGALAH